MTAVSPCWRCGVVPEVDPNGGYPVIACRDCYDGADDSTRSYEIGNGLNRAEAIAMWNEKMEELAEDPPANDTPLAYVLKLEVRS